MVASIDRALVGSPIYTLVDHIVLALPEPGDRPCDAKDSRDDEKNLERLGVG